jgi:serine/tyrosine/threonine adenylyltransferase
MTTHSFRFDNRYARLPELFFTKLAPTPVPDPKMVVFNESLAAELGLVFSGMNAEEKAALFAGNVLPRGSEPLAQAYAGHQFGHFTVLGDGRAHLIGEHITPDEKRYDVQLKGSGRTPYSRSGDGRAPLGPMLREYMISEAMHALGIPTTRSLAVVSTGERLTREIPVPGAVLTRIASSHIRVGTFEYAASIGEKGSVEALLDYTIERHYPDLKDSPTKALALLGAVMDRQIDLIVHWMRVGFIHGVMNTDNMALSGETIDYGPCAFMDHYDPESVFSSIDHAGRYAYHNQPSIAQWNLARFAETLVPLLHANSEKAVTIAQKLLNDFPARYQAKWQAMMRSKLGLFGTEKDDERLITDLLNWMQQEKADYTNTFLDLGTQTIFSGKPYDTTAFQKWYARWQDRLRHNGQSLESSRHLMRAHNPSVIARNHLVERVLGAAIQDELTPLHDLLNALTNPYEKYSGPRVFQLPPAPSERVYQTFCGT